MTITEAHTLSKLLAVFAAVVADEFSDSLNTKKPNRFDPLVTEFSKVFFKTICASTLITQRTDVTPKPPQ